MHCLVWRIFCEILKLKLMPFLSSTKRSSISPPISLNFQSRTHTCRMDRNASHDPGSLSTQWARREDIHAYPAIWFKRRLKVNDLHCRFHRVHKFEFENQWHKGVAGWQFHSVSCLFLFWYFKSDFKKIYILFF